MRSQTKLSRFCIVLITLTMLALFTDGIAHADSIYITCQGSSESIIKIDASGNKSVFASGSDDFIPRGLAFDNSGNLFVANWDMAIEKFDSSGNRTTFVSGITSPSILTFDNSGNLFAGSTMSIDKYNSSGKGTVFASWPNLYNPLGIVTDNSGDLYVSNNYSMIFKFDSNGNKSTFASPTGSGSGIAIDSIGNIYLAVSSSFSGGWIEKYDPSGNRTIFASGLSAGLTGLAIDSSNNLYAANIFDGTITKIDSVGNWSIFASGLDQPISIAVIPEPATLLLLGLGGMMLRKRNI